MGNCDSRRWLLPAAAAHVVVSLREHVSEGDRKSTRLNSSHSQISYAVFCLKKKKKISLALKTLYLCVTPESRLITCTYRDNSHAVSLRTFSSCASSSNSHTCHPARSGCSLH